MTCHHIWIPLDERVEECTRCGARRQTPKPVIDTTTIHGEPIQWPPITEHESHE